MVGAKKTHRSLPRLNKQRLSLIQHQRHLPRLLIHHRLQPSLNPRLPPLHLGRLRAQHDELACATRRLVRDVQAGRHADLVGQGREAAAREPLIEEGRQQPAVNDAGVAAQGGADVVQADHARAVGGGEDERGEGEGGVAQEGAGGEVVVAEGLGDAHVGAGFGEGGVGAQAGDERVRLELGFELGGAGRGRGLPEREGFGVGRGREEVVGDGQGGGGGHGGAEGEGDGGEEEDAEDAGGEGARGGFGGGGFFWWWWRWWWRGGG